MKNNLKSKCHLQTDFWDDLISIRNCILGYQCKQDWNSLLATNDQNIKYCRDCQRSIFKIANKSDLMDAIQVNRCVAIKLN